MGRRNWFAGSALFVALVVGAFLALRSKPNLAGRFGQKNALWCQSLYLRGHQPTTLEPLKEADLTHFCDTLTQNRIQFAYLFSGPFDTNGHLPEYAFSQTAIASVRTIKERCPGVIVLPWIGGIVNKTVFVDNHQWVSNAVHETSLLLSALDVTGVHVNLEFFTYHIQDELFPGLEGFDHYGGDEIRFFKELRSALPLAFISTVVVSTAPEAKHWKRKNTVEEVHELSKLVDQIAILCFDTSIGRKSVFRESLQQQLADIRQWKTSPMTRAQFLIGIGTFINKEELWKFRDLDVESVANTLNTLRGLLVEPNAGGSSLVDGLAIFAEWTTDTKEWEELQRGWLREVRQPF